MIVVDASAAVSALLTAGPGRSVLAVEQLHVPHLIDSEIASVLRRRVIARDLAPDAACTALDTWRRIGGTRYPVFSVLDRVWHLRDNLSSYNASYVAIAERLPCSLLTADGRLARAPGVRCPVTVVPG